ncbi:MAG: orotidine 5'-phosphate decarboxylase [Candidatus Komeilibacteria bacterium RIFCSPLOWO2_02_FULL_48_11]|uniref:Orotidine 5'-phosphate decarboxylase n=1 Tax=Candidatus Komeilibacteria bacterium RIFCSPLOWO2_02_FULL_48_11 TaxID=1798553 RepID=A0A1G2BU06_9BACT|nr:MAG: orotidine 5'-phosphate decarboxylase [Candidatus Komeilibacteria bacterium RIFCSPLOWO2_02_FULL_48_11]
MGADSRINVALDRMSKFACVQLTSRVGARTYAFKIHSLWDTEGPGVVEVLKKEGAQRVWVDLKLHDTPDTVADRAKAVRDAGGDILTVHAAGGVEMMMAALENGPAEVYAITVLTSLSEEETHLLSGQPAKAAVLYRARLAKLAGLGNLVCSPNEVNLLSKRPELKGVTRTTPGIRLAGQVAGQQVRFDTPAAAIKNGADRLVLGSAVTKAENPAAAFDAIEAEIAKALQEIGGVS